MKELTIEEKARAYDEVRKKIALRFGSDVAEKIFSEFEMSEDEKVRKELINVFSNREKYLIDKSFGDITVSEVLAWLEKQCYTKKDVDDAYLKGICNTKHELEKQGDQKSVDKEYTFKSIPRLLDMIEPTDRSKSYCKKLIDSLQTEGYSVDAKIVGECLKQMNGEKVAMAVMDTEKQDEQKPQRMVSAEAKEALYDKPTDEEMKELLRTEYEKGRADTIAEMKKDYSEDDESNKLLALERKACITKTIEWFFIQLNEGDIQCGDIEKFVENYKKYMEELSMKLIDKSAVEAEIEDKINKYTKRGEESDAKRDGYAMYWGGVLSCLNEVRSFLDTIEVKEVDLEKEINSWVNDLHTAPTFEELDKFAKHFFELGINAKGG